MKATTEEIFKVTILFSVEADEELKESETSRNLEEGEKKEKPSELISAVEKGFGAIAEMLGDEVNG